MVKFNQGINVSLGKCIGEGAFSFVYKGSSVETKQNYAIKKVIIQSSTIANDVKSEVNSLHRFVHPNIIELLDCVYVTESNNASVAYMLFPFAENGTLRSVLTAQLEGLAPKQYIDRVLMDFLHILDALRCLHEYAGDSYVHFDLKPENVLIFGDGKPVLTDFGSVRIAKTYIDSRQKALTIADQASEHCTMPYRSPELFDPLVNSSLDSRTDIWSVGCLLFAWWYGYSPFECEFASPCGGSASGGNSSNSGGCSDIKPGAISGGRGTSGVEMYEKTSDDGSSYSSRSKTNLSHNNNSNNKNRGCYMQYTQQCYAMKVVPCSHLRILAAPPSRPNAVAVAAITNITHNSNSDSIGSGSSSSDISPVSSNSSSSIITTISSDDPSSDIIDTLVATMLRPLMTERPFLKQVIQNTQNQLSRVHHGNGGGQGCSAGECDV